MENVGQSKSRNKEFQLKFTRERLLKHIVGSESPVIFDVGAHEGESVTYLKKIFPKCLIFSFEPDPDSFLALAANKVEGVTCFNTALSDTDGNASFYCNKLSHTNSLLKVNLSSKDSIGITKAVAENDRGYFHNFNKEMKVKTIKLDTFIKQYAIKHVDLLKIDVQGAERRVLAGGVEALERTRVVILEINFFDYYESKTSFLDVEQILLPKGFGIYSLSELSNNPMNGRTDWAEVVYINQKFSG